METVLITGANSGIGLEFVRQYAEAGAQVIACARDPGGARDLNALAVRQPDRIEVVSLDVADPAKIEALGALFKERPLDVLISNAGVGGGARKDPDRMDYTAWEHAFAVNTMATMRLTETLLPALRRSPAPRIIAISSKLASISDNTSGGRMIYRSTKTALNQVMKCLAEDLNPLGIIAVPMHPGWVRTNMGGPNATLTPEKSIASLRRVIAGLTLADSGHFLNWDGEELPW